MICDGMGLLMHSKRRLKSSECRRRVIIETDLVQRSLQDGSRTSCLMLLGFILKVSGSIWAQYIAGVRAVLPTTLGSCFECSKRLYYGSVPDPPGYMFNKVACELSLRTEDVRKGRVPMWKGRML